MRFRYVERVFVGVHTAENPRDDEWAPHCVIVARERMHTRGVIVYTAGGGPNSTQRKMLRDALQGTLAPPTAIMTDLALVRGIITSIGWFAGDKLAAFAHHDLAGALRHIREDGPPLDLGKIQATLISLAQELSVKLPTAFR